ncbi:bifunctional diguanylate cyclase/phosphodiesterase [Thalassotalea marina]|nr:EAL domain-containing protein [Thalassotalea marina]
MKKIFISVPTKLLLLIISALLLMSIGISTMSLNRLKQEFRDFQIEKVTQGQKQLAMHTAAQRERLSLWIESFADVIALNQHSNPSTLADALFRQYDGLQMNHAVENIWLLDSQGELKYSTTEVDAEINQAISKVLEKHEPYSQLYCNEVCLQLVVVPLLNDKGELFVVAMSMSLTDVVFAINQSLKSEIAVVNVSADNADDDSHFNFLFATNMVFMTDLFQSYPKDISISDFKDAGLEIDYQQKSYLINLMHLATTSDKQFYLALVDDVSSIKQQYKQQAFEFLLSALLIFIALAVLVYFVASPFTNRILTLSSALPLLAKREFEQFRQIRLKGKRMLADELDIVADAATDLSYELEQLNIEVEQKTQELENIAMYDLLTGLPNRNMLNYQLKKAVANIGIAKTGVAVLFLDLDDFKKVNDSHGHGEGDKLLIEAANRLRICVKHTDLACRFGGDEFVIVLSHITNIEQVVPIAEEILEQFKQPIRIGSSVFYVSTSIGIAFSDEEIAKPEQLISRADIAMYEAKDNGGAQYHIYHTDMYQRVAHRVMMETEVRQALAKGQFSLSLQPQLQTATKKLCGFEALLRWNHPEKGMISPDDFIPILENSEHMVELGYWVIRRCFEISSNLQRSGLTDVTVSINLSAVQFIDFNLTNYLKALLEEFQLPASCFELELTEQTLVKDIERAIECMQELRSIGFSFAIDDFGTGYSSLAYIKKMPVDVIKIDKSFVFGMLENHADYQIIMSTIAMVKNLGLVVVAEGVESSAQLRSLAENDCDIIQGYYFSKPIPEHDLAEFLDTRIANGYWKIQPAVCKIG